jgi:polyisoprenoid-binding protein YceI
MTPQDTTTTPAELGLPTGTWRLDPAASRLEFMVKTMWGLATVNGHFDKYDGTLDVRPDGVDATLTIDPSTLDTGHAKRDEHLRAADFFNVGEHAEIAFVATAITPRDGGLTITGDLRVRTTTVRLHLPVDVQHGENGRLHLTTATDVTRDKVGLTWNKLGMIRGDAHLRADLELVPDR